MRDGSSVGRAGHGGAVTALLSAALLLGGCGDDGGTMPPDDGGTDGARDAGLDAGDAGRECPTGDETWPLEEATIEGASPSFPEGFLWGTATAPHQIEGGPSYSGPVASDWWEWERMDGTIAGGDLSADGPDGWAMHEADADRMQSDGMTAYRLGIDWAKIFPTRESFDSLTPDADAVQHYHEVLTALRDRGIEPMVTLHHFVSPTWWLDPTASAEEIATQGWASDTASEDFGKWATWVAEEYGDQVDLWITINEPLVLVLAGYLTAMFPPGLAVPNDEELVLKVVRGQIFAHAAAYDALHAADTVDADGDGEAVLASISKHQRIFVGLRSCSTQDAQAAEQLRYLNNELFLNAIVDGDLDGNGDGDLDDPEDTPAHPDLQGRADFLGINYYSISLVEGRVRFSDLVPGVPNLPDSVTDLPKNDLGWAIHPAGLHTVLSRAWEAYGLPIYVTENGVADQGGVLRAPFVTQHLHVLAQAIDAGIDVRGYFHWSFMDNFEWAEGFCPRFGLYRVDYGDPERPRTATEGLEAYRQIVAAGRVPSDLVETYRSYGEPTPCEE